ncbi:hypothetical protein CDIK_0915 [Cucumispora dikerogammari]|nr:hypothetical protein CDIK_0915 [Cucumispora dikerogammari]
MFSSLTNLLNLYKSFLIPATLSSLSDVVEHENQIIKSRSLSKSRNSHAQTKSSTSDLEHRFTKRNINMLNSHNSRLSDTSEWLDVLAHRENQNETLRINDLVTSVFVIFSALVVIVLLLYAFLPVFEETKS